MDEHSSKSCWEENAWSANPAHDAVLYTTCGRDTLLCKRREQVSSYCRPHSCIVPAFCLQTLSEYARPIRDVGECFVSRQQRQDSNPQRAAMQKVETLRLTTDVSVTGLR